MKFLKSITALMGAALLTTAAPAQEGEDKADKIGSVNMQRLLNSFYKTTQTRNSFKQYEERLKEADKKKLDEIAALVEEAKTLRESAEGGGIDIEKKSRVYREATFKQSKAEGMQRGRVTWAQQKQAAFNEKINVELAKHRKEIIGVIKELAKEDGYDFIFDRSGTSGAGVPILSYSKDATDLTGVILERINKDAPEEKEGE